MGTILKADMYPGFDLDYPAISAAIEPGILPVCEALNSLPDVVTLWSCEGHPDLPCTPYVVFVARQDLAFRIDQLLAPRVGGRVLKYSWRLIASFRPDGSLQYILEPNDVRLQGGWLSFLRPLFSRKKMDGELRCLAELIQKGAVI